MAPLRNSKFARSAVARLLFAVAVLLSVSGLGAHATGRPLLERREGNALARLVEQGTPKAAQESGFFFHHLHKKGQWPELAAYAMRVDPAALSDVESVRGILLTVPRDKDGPLSPTTVQKVNETASARRSSTPYAHLLPMVSQKQYMSDDAQRHAAPHVDPREARLSGTRHWPYYFRYTQFESLAAQSVHTQRVCGVAQLDRGSFGLESFGVDEVLVLVYNDWNSHVEHALTLAEDFARLHLSLHELGTGDAEEKLTRAARQVVRAAVRDITPAPTFAVPSTGAFVEALDRLTSDPVTVRDHDAQTLAQGPLETCDGPNAMLWIPTNRDPAPRRPPMQLVAAARQRQFGSLWTGAPFRGMYGSVYLLDLARATPYFAVVRDGVVSPAGLPVTADTTVDDLRRLVVQQSPSTFALDTAEQFVRLANHYGVLAVARPVAPHAVSPWNDSFQQAFVAVRASLPMFGLHEDQFQRLPWDQMPSRPPIELTVPASADLLPDLAEWNTDDVHAGLGFPRRRHSTDRPTPGTPAPVCVRLIEVAARHIDSETVAVRTTPPRSWRWQDVCVPGPARGKTQERLWDRLLGATLHDAVHETLGSLVTVPDIRNGLDFRRTMRRLLHTPAATPTQSPQPQPRHVVVVMDDADGTCGDAARSHMFEELVAIKSNSTLTALKVVVTVVDAAARTLQEEVWSAAEAAMRRRQGRLPRAVHEWLGQAHVHAFGLAIQHCRMVLATDEGALYLWQPSTSAHVKSDTERSADPARKEWPLESPSRAALHSALEEMEARLADARLDEASHAELRSVTRTTDSHSTPWQLVLPAGQDHPVVVLEVATAIHAADASHSPPSLEVVALTDHSCGLCANVLKSLRLLHMCNAPVAEVDLQDMWLQRRGAATMAAPTEATSPLLASVRTHLSSDLAALRPPQWFVANGTHVLTSLPSSGYVVKNSWDVVVIEWMRLMGLPDSQADALHRCAQARIAEETHQRRRFRGAFAESTEAEETVAEEEEIGATSTDSLDGIMHDEGDL